MPEPIYKLVYVSAASEPFSETELWQLLEKARAANQQLQITGFLLYADGSFIQLLEGAEERVETLYRQIIKDKRHRNFIRLYSGHSQYRDFPGWSMGFKRIQGTAAAQAVPGFNKLIEAQALSPAEIENVSDNVRLLIESFRQTAGVS